MIQVGKNFRLSLALGSQAVKVHGASHRRREPGLVGAHPCVLAHGQDGRTYALSARAHEQQAGAPDAVLAHEGDIVQFLDY